jgi:hypothetical protein
LPFAFSTPYLYSSLTFGGDSEYVDCIAQNWDNEAALQGGVCDDVHICVLKGSDHEDAVLEKFPPENVTASDNEDLFYNNFAYGDDCNVIAGDQFEVSKNAVRNNGVPLLRLMNYTTTVDRIPMKNYPVSMITRKNDVAWSDFVNWVVIGLLYSEQQKYAKGATYPTDYAEWDVFGDDYKNSFFFTNRDVGNFGEIYNRSLEAYVPRQKINTINSNGMLGGVMYSIPFGNLERSYDGSELKNSTLYKIQNATLLECGVRYETVFANRTNNADGTPNVSGFDVDFCRALSAAIFGDPKHVNYTDLSNVNRWKALKDKSVDVLSRITTFTLYRDVTRSLTFSQPTFFDTLFFAGEKE